MINRPCQFNHFIHTRTRTRTCIHIVSLESDPAAKMALTYTYEDEKKFKELAWKWARAYDTMVRQTPSPTSPI